MPRMEQTEQCSTPSPPPQRQGVQYVCVVQFKWGRADQYLTDGPANPGEHVIVEGDRGQDLGMLTAIRVAEDSDATLQRILRPATAQEIEFWRGGLSDEEQEARTLCQEIVRRHGVPLKVERAVFQFDMRKLTFFYSSSVPQPIFRDCLSDCFAVWKCRVWFQRAVKLPSASRSIISQQDGEGKKIGKVYFPAPEAIDAPSDADWVTDFSGYRT